MRFPLPSRLAGLEALNVDVIGYEFRSDSGFFFSLAAGLFKGLGGGAVCPGDCEGGSFDVTSGLQARIEHGAVVDLRVFKVTSC